MKILSSEGGFVLLFPLALTTHTPLIAQTNIGVRRTLQAEAIRGCSLATVSGSVLLGGK